MNRILGIDLGEARTGVAISDELKLLAHPLRTISEKSRDRLMREILGIVSEREVEKIVIGWPRNMNGSLGPKATEAQAFAEKLRSLVACEVVLWDERLSTVAAERALREAGKKTRATREIRDQVAAQVILQGYLDSVNA